VLRDRPPTLGETSRRCSRDKKKRTAAGFLSRAAIAEQIGRAVSPREDPVARLFDHPTQRSEAGGDEQIFNRHKTVLDAMGDQAAYIGPIGAGTQAEVPMLTIALNAALNSLGPFNRAFKAETGITQSEFRRLRPPAIVPVRRFLEPASRIVALCRLAQRI